MKLKYSLGVAATVESDVFRLLITVPGHFGCSNISNIITKGGVEMGLAL